MALGISYGGGGDGGEIMSYVKYDARAGRMTRIDRAQGPDGNYFSESVDITNKFKAVMDFENIEVGWMHFAAGQAPTKVMVKIGQPIPAKPDPEAKMGARVIIKLHADCGGDLRELAGNSAAFMRGIDNLHTDYEADKAANPGKLPVVILHEAKPVTTGQGARKSTNYEPVFRIMGWAPRPTDLGATVAPTLAPSIGAPSTGSTQVGPPVKVLEPAGADEGFG
jgi:hypothetical protein